MTVRLQLNMDTLLPDLKQLEALLQLEKVVAFIVAHVYGRRNPLDRIVGMTRARGVPLIEDCAESFDGLAFRGHPGSDLVLFSFGSIKASPRRQRSLGRGLTSLDRYRRRSVAGSASYADGTSWRGCAPSTPRTRSSHRPRMPRRRARWQVRPITCAFVSIWRICSRLPPSYVGVSAALNCPMITGPGIAISNSLGYDHKG